MKILQVDSRLLYVPVGIKKLSIDPLKHLEVVDSFKDNEPLIPVHVYKDCNMIKYDLVPTWTLLNNSCADLVELKFVGSQ
jgi:hypothetical protein